MTDGIIAPANWYFVENVAGTGPYVGWRNVLGQSTLAPNPKVTFRFADSVNLNALTIDVADSDGFGGVSVPSSVDIGLEGGVYTNFLLADPTGSSPASFTFAGLGLTGSAFDVVFNNSNMWVFVSEVTFDGGLTAVPEPATTTLVLSGLAAMAARRRRQKGRAPASAIA